MSKMKHFLRKFHIGGSSGCGGGDVTDDDHQNHNCQASIDDSPPESSPLEQQPSTSTEETSQTTTSVSSSAPAFSEKSSTVSSANATANAGDYGLREEEFQVQLALAISVSDRDSREDTETAQIKTAKQISLGCLPSESLVDFMSLQYWSYNVVNYDEKVMDGFYDVHGFNSDMMPQEKMPTLADLQSISVAADDNYQVIIVNSAVDTELRKLVDKVHLLPIKYSSLEVDSDITVLVRKIAYIVVDRMGGPVNDAEEMPRKWTRRSYELKKSLNSIILSLGCLDVGLSRHRALLFKVLADQINLPCKLVKGSYYSGTDDGAVNLIKFSNGSEHIVDLMGAPGTLIPSEVSSSHQELRGATSVGDATYPEFSSGSVSSGPGIIGAAKISTEPFFANSKLMEQSGDAFGDTFKEVLNYEFGNISLLKVSEEPLKAEPKRSAVQVANTPGHLVISSEGSPILDFPDLVRKGDLLGGETVVDSHHFPLVDLSNKDQATIPFTGVHLSSNVLHTASGVGSSTGPGNVLVDNRADPTIKTVDLSEKFGETTLSHQNDQVDTVLGGVAEWEIPWEDLLIAERIGIGSYGEVHRAEWNGTEVAVKKFMNQDISGDALAQFKCEIEIMLRLRHPNLVLFMGAVTRPPNLSILTEYLPRGSLFKLLHRSSGQIDEKRRLRMAIDVAKGMNYLHTSHPMIVHRDLKTPNLLVDKNWGVKVCDFGMSRLKHHTFLSSKSTAGTAEWMAPEVLRNEPCNEKCDVYSFGVILWELATLEVPWMGMNSMQVVGAVGFQGRRLKIPDLLDPMAADLIIECWTPKPVERPSFAQILTRLKHLQHLVLPKADTPIHQP